MAGSTAEYSGSSYLDTITPNTVLSTWENERAHTVEQPTVIVAPSLTASELTGEALATKQHADGTSLLRLKNLNIDPDKKGAVVVANLQSAQDVFNIMGLGQVLQQKDVENVLLLATRLYGQRQDQVFVDHQSGQAIKDTVTSFDVLGALAAVNRPNPRRKFRRLIILEPHSSRLFQQGAILGLPALGLSAYRLLAQKADLSKETLDRSWGILGPDKGRHTTSHLLAKHLNLPVFSFMKERDRETGKLKIINAEATRQDLKQAGIKRGIMFDDEIQSAETSQLIAQESELEEITILATHANFSPATNSNLSYENIRRVVVTNAMTPKVPIEKLESGANFEVVDIWPSLIAVSKQLWVGEIDKPLPDGLVLDPWFLKRGVTITSW